jgi:hypothetical protein
MSLPSRVVMLLVWLLGEKLADAPGAVAPRVSGKPLPVA